MTKRLTRREKRLHRQHQNSNNTPVENKMNFSLKSFYPLTDNQRNTFAAYEDGKHLLLTGTAGTGKSFLSLYLGMTDVVQKNNYDKLVIVRSIVSSRDIGFLPGSNKEKSKVYESPYYGIFAELFGRGDAYEYLKAKGVVEFMNTSFVRGITISNAVIVIDETQSMTWHEISSIFTRIGENCRVIFAGDTKQNDLHSKRDSEASGYRNLIDVINYMPEFETVNFTSADIVRSGLVKSFITTCEKLGY